MWLNKLQRGVAGSYRWGLGLPERVVELSLARGMCSGVNVVLDVGYAGSQRCHIEMVKGLPSGVRLIGLDTVRAPRWVSRHYDTCIEDSVLRCPLPSGSVDLVWCISTFEHIRAEDRRLALRQMLRVMKPGGRFLLTVPFGRFESYDGFTQFDAEMVDEVLESVPHGRVSYYRHDKTIGWTVADRNELAEVLYYDQDNAGAAALAALMV